MPRSSLSLAPLPAPLPALVLACALLAGLGGTALPAASRAAAQEELTPVCAIQGGGGNSPLLGQTVTLEGVVHGDFIETALGAFFLQEPDCDGDDATSDGLMIYTSSNTDVRVAVGHRVRVTGTVEEYYGMTQVAVDNSTGHGVWDQGEADLPEPVVLAPPEGLADGMDYLDAREGMYVALAPSVVVGGTNAYGEPYVIAEEAGLDRLWRTRPDGRKIGLLSPEPRERLMLTQGDRITGLRGALNYTYDNYKVMVPDPEEMDVEPSEREPDRASPPEGREITIATYNLENFFDTVDDEGKDDLPWTPDEETYEAIVARRARSIADFLGAPTIVGVQEVETIRALGDLATHPFLASASYEALLVEGPDVRGIDVGYLYRADRLRLRSHEQAQACLPAPPGGEPPPGRCALPDGAEGYPLFSRPPLVARFQVLGSDMRMTLIVNHFKSKRGGDEVTTPVRVAMAEHVLGLMEAEKAADPDAPVFVLGDLNDFPDSAPLAALTGSGALVDPQAQVPAPDRYSYIFNGVSQILDYILVEPDLDYASFAPVHCNADFPAPAEGDATHPSPRTSDHDPLLLRLAGPSGSRIFLPWAGRDAAGVGGDVPTAPPPTGTSLPSATPSPAPSPTSTPQASAPRSPLRISELHYDGDVPQVESDEYIELENVTAEALDLEGWTVLSVRGEQRYVFGAGAAIEPGQACRLYTNEAHPELDCAFDWMHAQSGVWRNAGDKAEVRAPDGTLSDHACYGDYEGQCP